jgi:DNA (cytosine-5)-methyltransferase 1
MSTQDRTIYAMDLRQCREERPQWRPEWRLMTTTTYSAISLYCGAGGLDLGFERAGFDIRWAIDNDRWAVETYNENLAPRAVCGDVLQIDPPSRLRPDVVIGGPPCQGFSVIGRMDPTDPRSRHVEHFLDVVAATEPRAFVMENVKALAANPRWAPIRERLADRTEALGYRWMMVVLDAQRYDVPQARERMFLVGLRDGMPSPPPASSGHPPTVREALSGLPLFGSPGNDGICSARVVPARAPVMRPSPYRGSLMFNGSGRPLQLDGVAKTLPASMGGNATPIIDQDELEHGAEPWVVAYHARLLSGKRPFRRAPRRMRRITVQEAAALQTFPESWVFRGPQVAQYRQIGNAVPSRLAHAVAQSVRDALERATPHAIEEAVLVAA